LRTRLCAGLAVDRQRDVAALGWLVQRNAHLRRQLDPRRIDSFARSRTTPRTGRPPRCSGEYDLARQVRWPAPPARAIRVSWPAGRRGRSRWHHAGGRSVYYNHRIFLVDGPGSPAATDGPDFLRGGIPGMRPASRAQQALFFRKLPRYDRISVTIRRHDR
jgi:hypothetical protein